MTSRSNCQTQPSILTDLVRERHGIYKILFHHYSMGKSICVVWNHKKNDGELLSKLVRTLFHPNNISYVGRMIIRPSNESGRSRTIDIYVNVFRTADHADTFSYHTCSP